VCPCLRIGPERRALKSTLDFGLRQRNRRTEDFSSQALKQFAPPADSKRFWDGKIVHVQKGVTVPTSAISSTKPIDSLLISPGAANARQAAATTRGSSFASSTADSASSLDTLTQDIVQLLKSLASGDIAGARTDLAKFKADAKGQESEGTSTSLGKDLTSLLKDLTTGNRTAQKTDITRLSEDFEAQEVQGQPGPQSPLHSLIAKLSDSLRSGSVQRALDDLTSYLVKNGGATGSLINTSA
jgi:hypothetical protein